MDLETENSLTVKKAITKGLLFVNLPVFFFLALPIVVGKISPEDFDSNKIAGFSFIPAFIIAWIWWSWSLPRWRLWAVKRVDDVENLLHQAIQNQLMWRPGHFFQKTEISTRKQKEELKKVLYKKLDTSDKYLNRMIKNLTE